MKASRVKIGEFPPGDRSVKQLFGLGSPGRPSGILRKANLGSKKRKASRHCPPSRRATPPSRHASGMTGGHLSQFASGGNPRSNEINGSSPFKSGNNEQRDLEFSGRKPVGIPGTSYRLRRQRSGSSVCGAVFSRLDGIRSLPGRCRCL